MKLTIFLILISCFATFSASFSQQVSISVENERLVDVMKTLRQQSDYAFVFNAAMLKKARPVTITAVNKDLVDVLEEIFTGQPLDYEIEERTIRLKEKTASIIPAVWQQNAQIIRGMVTDSLGTPLSRVTVEVKDSPVRTMTNEEGAFVITLPEGIHTLLFSSLGFIDKSVTLERGQEYLSVRLTHKIEALEDLVVIGIVERKRESFTGAVTTFSGEELKNVGNQNILQSLKTLDPSFMILENNELGSNPNVLPDVEMRGQTSLSTNTLRGEFGVNPNQPLFILDGFETDLQTIVDMDMTRVASITLLKDAASTAMYGAKAANGVVVVESRSPDAGRMRISYNADLRLDAPDLRSYNLMDAAEKLEFEKLSGRWDNNLDFGYSYQPPYDSLYNVRLAQVRRGVDTYWLSMPLRNGFTNGHSLHAEGGDQQVRYGVGVNFRNLEGVMKGSGRETWGGSFDLIYRKNRINVSNKLYLNGHHANESAYGSFSNFAQANPYLLARDEEGKVHRLLEAEVPQTGAFGTMNVPNPLYNALLDNRDQTRSLGLRNNLQIIWTLSDALRVQGGMQLNTGRSTTTTFTPPEHTRFDNSNLYEKGEYTQSRTDNTSYQGNVMLTYARVLDDRHRITANLRADIEQTENNLFLSVARGFPLGSNGDPSFAFGYQPNAKPATAHQLYRRNNVLASANYSYDNRYLLDATYRIDGSTAFGSARKYSPFWSLGLGWNLHNEAFFNYTGINTLRLRGNIGETGNQNFGSVTSLSVYSYDTETNIFGQGVKVSTFGNPNLAWQKTLSTSVGLDLVMMNNRLSARFNAYRNFTDPLVVVIDLPSSTGVYGYATNAGNMLTRGLEADLRFSPIFRPHQNVVWTLGVMGHMIRSVYGGFSNQLESLNREQLQNSSLIRYLDGYSPNDLWTVRSLGIDPTTGKEVFLRADGQYTFDYNSANVRVVGNSRPDIEGVVSSNLQYKGFLLGLNLRFRFGGDLFNHALYNKVENISTTGVTRNQDRRALYDRWQQPGDLAQFKSISLTEQTPISSRFIQTENVITGESFNIGYQMANAPWMRQIGVQALRINVHMNDLLRISSITAERGTSYPFMRTVSSSVSITF